MLDVRGRGLSSTGPELDYSSSSISSSTNSGISTPLDGIATPGSTISFQSQLDTAKMLAADMLSITNSYKPLLVEDEDDGVDVTFECTGKEICMHTALYATRPGGKVIMVGMGTPIQTLPRQGGACTSW